jgi:hypothetical protein
VLVEVEAFLFSKDRRLLLKSLPLGETEAMLSIIDDYVEHNTKHKSYLMRALALHEFIEPVSGKKTFAIIAVNMAFPLGRNPREKLAIFDLKGRVPKRADESHKKNLHVHRGVLKDFQLNFRTSNRKGFCVSKEVKAALLEVFKQDVKFLVNHNMMDYSLLVGVEARSDGDNIMADAAHNLPIESLLNERYYVGIIDFLSQYGLKKKTAHFFKRFLWTSAELSTIPAAEYGDRFLAYIDTIWTSDTAVRIEDPKTVKI